MPEPAAATRTNAMTVGVVGARPYGVGGNKPQDAVQAVYSVHGVAGARPYVSDAPYVAPSYGERLPCLGTRKNGEACKAKPAADSLYCGAHKDQG